MKKALLLAALLALPTAASADHWDVIAFELNEDCSFETYMGIVSDFNTWGADYGYSTTVLMPLQHDDLSTHYWIGSTSNAAGFGATWDAWRDAQSDAQSTAAQLAARFAECSTNTSRRSYDAY
jgi:hypothetical protein